MTKRRLFGELELAILNIIQSKGGEVSVKEVHQTLGEKNSYTTVMTVMSRLAEKGELKRRLVGRQYLYHLAPQKPRLTIIDKLKQRLFGGKSSAMISYLIDSSEDLTAQDLEEMRTIIDQAKKKRSKP